MLIRKNDTTQDLDMSEIKASEKKELNKEKPSYLVEVYYWPNKNAGFGHVSVEMKDASSPNKRQYISWAMCNDIEDDIRKHIMDPIILTKVIESKKTYDDFFKSYKESKYYYEKDKTVNYKGPYNTLTDNCVHCVQNILGFAGISNAATHSKKYRPKALFNSLKEQKGKEEWLENKTIVNSPEWQDKIVLSYVATANAETQKNLSIYLLSKLETEQQANELLTRCEINYIKGKISESNYPDMKKLSDEIVKKFPKARAEKITRANLNINTTEEAVDFMLKLIKHVANIVLEARDADSKLVNSEQNPSNPKSNDSKQDNAIFNLLRQNKILSVNNDVLCERLSKLYQLIVEIQNHFPKDKDKLLKSSQDASGMEVNTLKSLALIEKEGSNVRLNLTSIYNQLKFPYLVEENEKLFYKDLKSIITKYSEQKVITSIQKYTSPTENKLSHSFFNSKPKLNEIKLNNEEYEKIKEVKEILESHESAMNKLSERGPLEMKALNLETWNKIEK
ncbi:MAG: hypothetical protein JO131_05870, partial [Gammaproteobacteria bacterium]|nr:hypothetical protein [Gammaproteobacteria bacterium]